MRMSVYAFGDYQMTNIVKSTELKCVLIKIRRQTIARPRIQCKEYEHCEKCVMFMA